MAKVKTTKADSARQKEQAFAAYEEVQEYFLSWALDGEFYPDAMNAADAAFAIHDVDTLRALRDEYRTGVDFIEAPKALKKALPTMKAIKFVHGGIEKTRPFTMHDFTVADRERILSTTPGTRAYARKQIENHGGRTPFDD